MTEKYTQTEYKEILKTKSRPIEISGIRITNKEGKEIYRAGYGKVIENIHLFESYNRRALSRIRTLGAKVVKIKNEDEARDLVSERIQSALEKITKKE